MNYEEAMTQALISIGELDANSEFMVKDLFMGTQWKSFDCGSRLSIGRAFKTRVTNGQIPNVEYIGKHSNNSALYKKL